jgi:CheY-like chemotaxis protein
LPFESRVLPTGVHCGPEKPLTTQHQSAAHMQILVADDAADNQLLIKYFLKGTGIEPSFVNNGIDAVAKAKSNEFDAILMDIQMPEMDGYEATGILRKQGYLKPIIALTAHTFKEEKEKALLSGFTDFVSKPISKHLLIQALRETHSPFVV